LQQGGQCKEQRGNAHQVCLVHVCPLSRWTSVYQINRLSSAVTRRHENSETQETANTALKFFAARLGSSRTSKSLPREEKRASQGPS
jgi:hypothetical protein